MRPSIERDHWPTDSQRLLLRAAWLQGEAAAHAWQEWQAHYDLDAIDHEGYQLLPQIFFNLNPCHRLHDADPTLARLKGVAKLAWVKTQMAQQSLSDVLHLFRTDSISSIVHGGLDLLLLGYRSQHTLQIDGINLLIRLEDLSRADLILQQADWRPLKLLPPAGLIPFFQVMSYTHPTQQNLCLSWRPFSFDAQREVEMSIWQHTVTQSVGKLTVSARLLQPTDLFLLTCSHLAHSTAHGRVQVLSDMKCIIETAGASLDWGRLYLRTKQLRLLHPLQVVLTVLKQDLETTIPDSFFQHGAHVSSIAGKPFPNDNRLQTQTVLKALRIHHRITALWQRYTSIKASDGRGANLIGFLRLAITYYQYLWGLQSRWLVPTVALIRLYQHLRQPSPLRYQPAAKRDRALHKSILERNR